jgi:serine/threonine protein kinase/tetratricopeptide (TPR) repeat protein
MVGTTVSHYKVLEHLGGGGMGVVYKARDTRLDRDVALKFLPATLQASPEELARFEQEAKAISTLNHPSIATIYDVDAADGQPFLVLEYISGGTLKSRLKQLKSEDRDLSLAEVVDHGIQIAEALTHAHRHGIIHRDVKPDNIMLTADGKVKLTDFGLARLRGKLHLTATGSTVGTAAYMSPEQVRAEEIDHRSDIFSLGVVLYELATTRLPFRGEYEAALSFSILNDTPAPLTSLRAEIPRELEQIVMRCLEKDKTKRYQDAGEIAAELQRLRQSLLGSNPAPPKHSWLPYGIIAAVLAAAVAGAWFLRPHSPSTGTNHKTIAVLPFTYLGGGQDEEYFSVGITDDIITQLAQIADLNVISRTSVMQYKGTVKGIREIGRELNAGVVLEGSVRRAGGQIRIVAQLIDAGTDKHVWAASYDREYRQVLAIQSEIASSIASALQARLSTAELDHLRAAPDANTDSASVLKAIGLYRQALAIDSTDARVWAAFAGAHVILANSGFAAMDQAVSTARQAARRATALDDGLAEGHSSLGQILDYFDWDWQGADREFRRALALEPGNALTLRRASQHAHSLGRFDEAIALSLKAIDLDPVDFFNYYNLGNYYYYARRLPDALAASRRAIELNPQILAGHQQLGAIYLAQGNTDSALAVTEREPAEVWRLFGLALVHHAAGRTQQADAALAELIRKHSEVCPYQIAEVYAYRGEADRAFEWLEKALRLRDAGMSTIVGDPLLARIAKDPRFSALLRRLKLAG